MFPILYHGPDLTIYSYPLLMGLGWGVAYHFFFELIPMTTPRLKAQLLFWGIFLSSWIGAKTLFFLTLPQQHSLEFSDLSFWTGGGFVFYGGLIAGLLFILVYRKFFGLTPQLLWPLLPALTFGHAIGRIGCFLAGCCYGKETNWFWGIYLHEHFRHPTQLIEACGLFILGIYLIRSSKGKIYLTAQYFLFYGLLRFGLEMLRGDDVRGQWLHMSPSQWISLALILLGLTLHFKNKKIKSSV